MPSPLTPFSPSPERPWTRARAAHLLRRAGFAPNEGELRRAVEEGPARAVERLLTRDGDSARHDELDVLGPRLAASKDATALRAWWLQRMVHTAHPLRARVSLMWHDHFATSLAKVGRPAMMLAQLRMLEQHGFGPFRTLVTQISRDPAMIAWLDGNENVRGRPNENYARELLELFTLGIGHYTEDDVQTAARAFTGWHQKDGRFRFVRSAHDDGQKSFFGHSGRLGGDDIIDAALEHPACATFLARRLLEEFVTPDPDDALTAALATHLRQTGYDVADALRVVFRSEAMFAPAHARMRIKGPVEFAVGLVRSLELPARGQHLARQVDAMGQRLFEPPSVKGWHGHRAWLTTTTMRVRLAFAEEATDGLDSSALRGRSGCDDAPGCLAWLANLTLDGNVPPALANDLRACGDDLRRMATLLTTAPEYQFS